MTEDRSKRRFLSVIFTVLILLISFPLIYSYDMLVFAQLHDLHYHSVSMIYLKRQKCLAQSFTRTLITH